LVGGAAAGVRVALPCLGVAALDALGAAWVTGVVVCGCGRVAEGDGAETTTVSAGGGDPERDPIGGRLTVPESRSSAIAAAPSSSGTIGAATVRAITQIARPLPRSSADTAFSSPDSA
jgi:hypothetical protein